MKFISDQDQAWFRTEFLEGVSTAIQDVLYSNLFTDLIEKEVCKQLENYPDYDHDDAWIQTQEVQDYVAHAAQGIFDYPRLGKPELQWLANDLVKFFQDALQSMLKEEEKEKPE
jgi:hypothetical protein